MIFNVPGHIEMIRNDIKTQTRRVNRGIYRIGRDYAVQQKRGVKAEEDIRIVVDEIKKETGKKTTSTESSHKYTYVEELHISKEDAWAEGNYTPSLYESDFRKAYPNWDGWSRWAVSFHVIGVQK